MGKIITRCVLTAVIMSGAATRSFGDQPKAGSPAATKPNILVFYVDDMSWAQPGCYGGQLAPTPNMDQLAQSGVRFTNGYSSGCVCSPGRVGLITGRYQARSGHDSNTTNNPVSELLLSEVTIAERLKAVGYTTGLVGKWHLGHSSAAYLPHSRGFDFSVGSIGNIKAKIGPDEPPLYFRGKETLATLPGAPITSPVYAREASQFIGQNAGHPWFLLLSFNAVHDPLAASPEWVARFSHLPKHDQYYAAVVAEADAAIGRVMAALREHGQEENTLIFLVSDNGNGNGSAESGGLRGRKWTVWEGGIKVSWIASWKGRIPTGRVVHDPVIQLDILPTALAAAGESVQPDWQIDGVNLLPLLEGSQPVLPPRELYFRFGVQYAVRAGDWKLVKASAEMEPMLVNLATDPAEANDLSGKEPAKRKELETLFASWNATMQPPRWRDHRWDSPEKQVVAPGDPRPKKGARAPAARRMPRVLLIGDSICGGYEKRVRQLLEGTAEVIKNDGNAEYTGEGIRHIDEWLGDGPWHVIHFNWGVWDMYGWRHRAVDRSPAMYEQRLEQLVVRLEQTGATLIWATTTPACPEPEATMRDRFKESVSIGPDVQQQYADAAMRVMKRHDVVINDLHALMWPDLEQYQLSRDNVHFNAAGSERMAAQVAAIIAESLAAGEGVRRASQPSGPRSRRNRLNMSP
jgi:arylsulfatase A-like enzyme